MRLFATFIFLLATALRLTGQNPLAEAVRAQYEQWPQEKIYIHPAADEYLQGDLVWLKVYIVDAQKLQNIDGSRYAYVELVDDKGNIRTRSKFIVRGGLYAGYLRIPEEVRSGIYTIRAYTRYSENTPWNICSRPLQIGQSKALEKEDEVTEAAESVLTAERQADGSVVLSVPDSRYYLIGTCRMIPFFAGGIKGGTDVSFADLPAGKVNFYALDADYRIVGRQTIYTEDVNGDKRCQINIKTGKESYRQGDRAVLNLDVSGLAEDEIADLSVSVAKNRHPFAESIGSALLQSNPEEGLDMDSVFHGRLLAKPAEQEDCQALEGYVRSSGRRKPVKDATIRLIAPKIGQYAVVNSDSTGHFVFKGLDDPEGTYYVLSALNAKGNDNVVLSVEEPVFPGVKGPQPKFREVMDTVSIEYGGIDISETVELRSAVVVADAVDPDAVKGMASMADFTFGEKEIEQTGVTCMHELLRRVPGIFINQEKVYVRAVTSIYGDNPAAIAIDGVIMPEEYDLDDIEMPMVARVDVFKTGQTVIWGTAGGSGVVSITTKTGSYIPGNKVERTNVKKVSLLGYQPKSTFQTDYRTLYWNPSVQSEKLEFPIPDNAAKGRWRIVLEGVTSKGRYIHEESELVIR